MPAHLGGEAGEPVSLHLGEEPNRHPPTIAVWSRSMRAGYPSGWARRRRAGLAIAASSTPRAATSM
jgi:hypothetical protein